MSAIYNNRIYRRLGSVKAGFTEGNSGILQRTVCNMCCFSMYNALHNRLNVVKHNHSSYTVAYPKQLNFAQSLS